jgi:hypothetical protein
MLRLITQLLELGVEYFKLQNKNALLNVLESFDYRIDKLNEKLQKVCNETTSDAQIRARAILEEIVEEQQKMATFLKNLEQ